MLGVQVTVRVGLALYAHFMGAQSWEAKGRMNDQPRTGHSEETGLGHTTCLELGSGGCTAGFAPALPRPRAVLRPCGRCSESAPVRSAKELAVLVSDI